MPHNHALLVELLYFLFYDTLSALFTSHTHSAHQPVHESRQPERRGEQEEGESTFMSFLLFAFLILEVDAQKRWKFMASFLLQFESWGLSVGGEEDFLISLSCLRNEELWDNC